MQILYPSQADPATLDALEFDATPSDGWTYTASITENPIERSAPAADHISVNPVSVSAEVVISPTPTRYIPNATGGVSGSVRRLDLGGGQATDVLQFSGALQRPEVLVSEILRLQREGVPVTVEAGGRTFSEMAIKSVGRSRNASEGDAIRLRLEFYQLRIVEVASAPEPEIPQARARRSRGRQSGEEETPATGDENRSLLSRLTGFGRRVNP